MDKSKKYQSDILIAIDLIEKITVEKRLVHAYDCI